MKGPIAWGIAAGLAASLGATAAPGDTAAHEIATAEIHVHAAQKMDTVAGSHLHLHHVVNCLVGVHGAAYSATAERLSANPCKGLGNGALADAGDDATLHARLEAALADALAGIRAQRLADVHADAAKASAALQAAHRMATHDPGRLPR